MLDFAEVMRRVAMRNADPKDVPHTFIVAPLVDTLSDPDYCDTGALLTSQECFNVARTIHGQAERLDELSRLLLEAKGVIEDVRDKTDVRTIHRYYLIGIGVAVAWLASIVMSVWLVV